MELLTESSIGNASSLQKLNQRSRRNSLNNRGFNPNRAQIKHLMFHIVNRQS
jgi:hypothetical protein